MSKNDYYEVLGVTKTTDPASIKSSYRKLAMKYHPDKNPGDKDAEKKFKEISEAYEVLSNPEKKEAYDTYGHDAFSQSGVLASLRVLEVLEVSLIFSMTFLVILEEGLLQKEIREDKT